MSKEIKGTYGYFYILKIPLKDTAGVGRTEYLMGDEQSSWTEYKARRSTQEPDVMA